MPELVKESVEGELYRYYPLGEHVVRAIGVCGGRPTFKYTRIEITGTLERLAAGVEVRRARATVSLCLRSYCPTLSTPSASLLRTRVPSSNAAEMPGMERDHRNGNRSLRAESDHR